jgi:deazaflavin-dependent oxidoreductase (nitroreductase family)
VWSVPLRGPWQGGSRQPRHQRRRSRVLEVPGRTSGQPRRTPVNLLTVDGQRYLVAPRGHTQWVRNLRVSGRGRLLLGQRGEPFTATEVSDGEKTPLLRAYLKRWKFEVGMFFGGVGPDSPGRSSVGSPRITRSSGSHPADGSRRVHSASAGAPLSRVRSPRRAPGVNPTPSTVRTS